MKNKKRLDLVVLEQYPQYSRNQVQSWIMQGKILINERVFDKPGTLVDTDSLIKLNAKDPKYVGRAGFKLEKAIEHFNVDVKDLVALDAGISTGGFTDCLLQNGAKLVYGVDVGHGQVHEKILYDKRLVLLERTNLRKLEHLPKKIDLVTLDLSFISILKVMPAICKLIKPDGRIITLIKPQFEAEREDIARGGVVKDESVYDKVLKNIETGMLEFGFKQVGVVESPILGAKSGNREFLALFIQDKVKV